MKLLRVLLFVVPIVAILAPGSAGATAVDPATCHITVFEGVAQRVDCPEDSHIATYKYRDGATLEGGFENSMPQTLFATGTDSAAVPTCGPWQADVFTGAVLPVIDKTHQYSTDDRLLAAVVGDAGECAVEATTIPSTTPTTVAVAPTKLARTGKSTTALEVAAGLLLIIGAVFILGSLAVSRPKRME